MYLSTPSKPSPALPSTSYTSTKHEAMKKKPRGLLFWSYPIWILGLTFLLVPQACTSPYLTSCRLDCASSLYSKATLDENPCYDRCFTSSCCVVLILLNVLNVYIYVIEQRVVRRDRRDNQDKKNETAECV